MLFIHMAGEVSDTACGAVASGLPLFTLPPDEFRRLVAMVAAQREAGTTVPNTGIPCYICKERI